MDIITNMKSSKQFQEIRMRSCKSNEMVNNIQLVPLPAMTAFRSPAPAASDRDEDEDYGM